MAQLAKSGKSPEAITREVYMIALAREPNSTELGATTKHLKSAKDLHSAVEDLGWVLFNSKEFLFGY
jgi:hypothetical protein